MTTELEKILVFIKDWKSHPFPVDYYDVIWNGCHDLAEAQYQPAKDFFVEGLDDPDWLWRQDCVAFLGFHYPLENGILEKIRKLLINDPSSDVRISAASVIGRRSIHPDQALFTALLLDPNRIVKRATFNSILSLAGVSYQRITQELEKIKKGETQPTPEELKRIFSDVGIENTGYFDENPDK
jgi:hypothetical protein